VDARLALRMLTPIGGRGWQELSTQIHYGRYGLPDMDVHISRFEGRNMRSCPRGRRRHLRHAFNGV
jgi:hypothetical protein